VRRGDATDFQYSGAAFQMADCAASSGSADHCPGSINNSNLNCLTNRFCSVHFFRYLRNWPGGDYMIIPLMTVGIFSLETLGRLTGVILAGDGMAEAVSPWFVDRMRDAHGTCFAGFLAWVGVAVLGARAVSGLPRKRRVA
jgi:hypothetical protein